MSVAALALQFEIFSRGSPVSHPSLHDPFRECSARVCPSCAHETLTSLRWRGRQRRTPNLEGQIHRPLKTHFLCWFTSTFMWFSPAKQTVLFSSPHFLPINKISVCRTRRRPELAITSSSCWATSAKCDVFMPRTIPSFASSLNVPCPCTHLHELDTLGMLAGSARSWYHHVARCRPFDFGG